MRSTPLTWPVINCKVEEKAKPQQRHTHTHQHQHQRREKREKRENYSISIGITRKKYKNENTNTLNCGVYRVGKQPGEDGRKEGVGLNEKKKYKINKQTDKQTSSLNNTPKKNNGGVCVSFRILYGVCEKKKTPGFERRVDNNNNTRASTLSLSFSVLVSIATHISIYLAPIKEQPKGGDTQHTGR